MSKNALTVSEALTNTPTPSTPERTAELDSVSDERTRACWRDA
jgi:hypothetical protein